MVIKELHQLFIHSSGVSTDSRQIDKDSLFFALKGENFDGNLYAQSAIEKGAQYAIVDDKNLESNEQCIWVEDVLTCLQQLAKYHRNQLNCPVLGITGTNGKTTTKELITCVIEQKFKTVSTKGNLNNHIGVPLTLLSAKLDTEFLIIEMGANHIHEIQFLCELAQIDFGIITNIGKAHLEGFGSIEGVIQAKKELYDSIESNKGTLFVNATDGLLLSLSEAIPRILYNTEKQAQNGSPFAEVLFQETTISSKLIGDYNRTNILAACQIGFYFGVSIEDCKAAIESYTPSNNRSQLLKTTSNTIVMDAYNANPSSMIEAIHAFEHIKHDKKRYILGDMLELGINSLNEHQSIVDELSKTTAEVILVGKEFDNCTHPFRHFYDSDKALQWIQDHPIKGEFVLLKGSRGIQVEKLKVAL